MYLSRLTALIPLAACATLASYAAAQPTPVSPVWTEAMKSAVIGLIVQRDGEKTFGTGFYIDRRYVMTAAHVVTTNPSPCDLISEQRGQPTTPKSKVLTISGYAGQPDDTKPPIFSINLADHPKFVIVVESADIAIMRVSDDPQVKPLPLNFDNQPEEQADISIYGYPLQDKGQVNRGIIADKTPNFTADLGLPLWAFELKTQEGESGGPIVDHGGKVVAVESCGNETRQYGSPVRVALNDVLNKLGVSRTPAGSTLSTVAASSQVLTTPPGQGPYEPVGTAPGFDRSMYATQHCGNSPESWVRGSASLDRRSGALTITVQLETDSIWAGPKGHAIFNIRDAQGQVLAVATTDDIGMGGRPGSHAAIQNFSKTVSIPSTIAQRATSLDGRAVCTGSVAAPFGIQSGTVLNNIKIDPTGA